jgi:hypothetical protein
VSQALLHAFGESATEQELDQRIEARIGDLVDRSDKQWFYQQFRPSLVGGKIPLVRRDTGQSVALIDGASIYRDAHPEGVYLAHQGERFRVVSYRMKPSRGNARRTEKTSAAFVSRVDQIVVDAEQRQVATRGKWREHVQLLEKQSPMVTGRKSPSSAIEYGKWEWNRRFDGYEEYDLGGKGSPREIWSLARHSAITPTPAEMASGMLISTRSGADWMSRVAKEVGPAAIVPMGSV